MGVGKTLACDTIDGVKIVVDTNIFIGACRGAGASSALTVRLTEDKCQRLRAIAETRGTSIDGLLDEMATLMLAEIDAHTRFRLRAERGRGNVERGLALLEKAAKIGTRP